MVELQRANKPNILYKLAYCIATKKPGTTEPLFPLDRMPFGLVQHQIEFFSSTNVSQVLVVIYMYIVKYYIIDMHLFQKSL
jgi:hypothetical protein